MKPIVTIEFLPSTLNFEEMAVVRGGTGGPTVECQVPNSGVIVSPCDNKTTGVICDNKTTGYTQPPVCDNGSYGQIQCYGGVALAPPPPPPCTDKTGTGKKE